MCAKGLEEDDEVWGINVGVKGQIIYLCIGDGRTEKLVYINLFIQMSIKLKPNSTRLMLVFIFTHCSTGGRSQVTTSQVLLLLLCSQGLFKLKNFKGRAVIIHIQEHMKDLWLFSG